MKRDRIIVNCGICSKEVETIRSRPTRYCSKKCFVQYCRNKTGENNPRWSGGRIVRDGYVYIYSPIHPNRTKEKTVCEHILVMEGMIGRYIKKGEIVHHINHIRNDNRPENLVLLSGQSEHRKMHPEISEMQREVFKGKHFSEKTEFKKK